MQPICTHKIGVESKKPSHAYPLIRLPREFRRLVGTAATIYETTHNGGIAFLVVPHKNRKRSSNGAPNPKSRLDMAEVVCSNHTGPIVLYFRALFDLVVKKNRLNRFYGQLKPRELITVFVLVL
ncbi:MAG: hypothetical protein ACXV5F_01380 [Halobacteriota archaeon]